MCVLFHSQGKNRYHKLNKFNPHIFNTIQMVQRDVDNIIKAVEKAVDLALTDTITADDEPLILDVPSLFFVSTKLAAKFDHLLESAIVLSFHSYSPPGRLTDGWRDSAGSHSLGLGHLRRDADDKQRASEQLNLFLSRFSAVALFTGMLHMIGSVSTKFQLFAMHLLQQVIIAMTFFGCKWIAHHPPYVAIVVVLLLYEVWRLWRLAHPNKVQPHDDAHPTAHTSDKKSSATLEGSNKSPWRSANRMVSLPAEVDGVNYWEDDEDEEDIGRSGLRFIDEEAKQQEEYWEVESTYSGNGADWKTSYHQADDAPTTTPALTPPAVEANPPVMIPAAAISGMVNPSATVVQKMASVDMVAPEEWHSAAWSVVDGALVVSASENVVMTRSNLQTQSYGGSYRDHVDDSEDDSDIDRAVNESDYEGQKITPDHPWSEDENEDDIFDDSKLTIGKTWLGEDVREEPEEQKQDQAQEELQEDTPVGDSDVLMAWLVERSNLADLILDPSVRECLNEPAHEGYWEEDSHPEFATLWS